MSDTLVSMQDVDLGYGRRPVLHVDGLSIAEGDFLGIVGPNGSGKSTLLKGILGLLPPQSGEIAYPQGRRSLRFGYVPQRESVDNIFPVTAREMVMMGRDARVGPLSWSRNQSRIAAERALEHVGLAGLAEQRFRDLSGGQQQRVLIARALAVEPRILVLDEPTNGMDLESEHALMELIASLHDADGLTVIMVSHLLNVLVNYVRHLVLVDRPRLLAGPLAEILTTGNLEKIYGTPVTIATVGGRRVVLPCDKGHTVR